ncbi:MAG TPA: hypothetical protein VJV39_06360 [Dongiaceae bacterium]|nr:hypothetical protein [Dongiaceae bacterium]
MRTNLVMLAVLAGLGLSNLGMAQAEAKNLSCISGISPSEQRLLRDCEPEPGEEIVLVYKMPVEPPSPPPPPPEPARMKHGESGKGEGVKGDKSHDAPGGGGNGGGSHGGGGSAAHGNESAGGSSAN